MGGHGSASRRARLRTDTHLYQNVIRTRKYDALLFGEEIGKDGDTYAFWHSSQSNAPGLNVAMYANSKADALLADIRKASSTDVETAEYGELDQLIEADLPAVFLYTPDFIYAVPKDLKGYRSSTPPRPPASAPKSHGTWRLTKCGRRSNSMNKENKQ